MSNLWVGDGNRQVLIEAVAPAGQVSTNAYVDLAGSAIDASGWTSICYTIAVITNSINWKVIAANASDFSDGVAVNTATVAAAAAGNYAVYPAPYRFYKVQITDTTGGQHGTATINGVAKLA